MQNHFYTPFETVNTCMHFLLILAAILDFARKTIYIDTTETAIYQFLDSKYMLLDIFHAKIH